MSERLQHTPDPWEELRRFTQARIALGRAGGSMPTQELLRFQASHASAIDAVYAEIDVDRLADELKRLGHDSIPLSTMAGDRETFLLRPDLGRKLSLKSSKSLKKQMKNEGPIDIAVIAVDGLSATSLHRNLIPLLKILLPRLAEAGHRTGPIPLVRQGRVALQDEIGNIMGARLALSLIGERPGLGAPDSLGAYLVYNPEHGNTDANRNCVSNIRPEGLTSEAAADTLFYLLSEALTRKISGIKLKDQRELPGGSRAILPR